MPSFLEHVATSLLQKYGSNLSHLTVVFPGKRASLFLNQALAEASPTPVWAPRYQTISELFQQASPYTLCHPVEAVCRLYRSYARYVEEPQSLDLFYSWGEILLADFDDIDKNMVDAQQLFTNIADIRALDSNAYITPEQEAALRAFFSHFSLQDNTELKERFLRLWRHMGEIYNDFRDSLRRDGLLYEGALQREVVEGKGLTPDRLSPSPSPVREGSIYSRELNTTGGQATKVTTPPSIQRGVGGEAGADAGRVAYVFVGFNALTPVERTLFDTLKARQQALFYWDYDLFYTESSPLTSQLSTFRSAQSDASHLKNFQLSTSHEAGHFIRQNISRYGNELPPECFDNLRQPKDITIITTTTENAQARYLPTWLHDHLTPQENQTAVVLCNENLLQPVLHSLPTDGAPQAVNITMGYPLASTPIYSLLNEAPLPVSSLLDTIQQLAPQFAEDADSPLPPIYRQLYAEALFQAFTTLSRLQDLMSGPQPLLDVSDQTLRRVLRTILQSLTIPFHGEPAIGLQVMGVLETRALDFKNLIMLSVGEGYLPKAASDTSLIPYGLREAFGLTTVRHKMAVWAYYFYRFIQRAEHITLVYNESNAGTRQNEQSRFIRQLLAETDFPVRFLRLTADSRPAAIEPPVIQKDEAILTHLRQLFDNSGRTGDERRLLSPSALNLYTACPLRFYYRYVRGLRIDPDPADGLDPILFGEVFHRAAELMYQQLTSRGPIIHAADLDPFIEKEGVRLQPIVRQAFRDRFFMDRPEEYTGILIIAERVLQTYLLQLLRHDRRHCPIRILGLERKRIITLHVNGMELDTGGIIDRLDQVADPAVDGGTAIRVIDYKTGGLPGSVAQLEQLFNQASQKEEYYLQTILYATIVARQENMPVTPCLFFVHKAGAEDYSPKLRLERLPLNDVRTVSDDFLLRLQQLITEIFDPATPFAPTAKADSCTHCHYRALCGR